MLQKRYAFDGTGWPLVQYDSAGNRSWMLPDERGSIVALANDSSAMTAINTYDEYGIPGATNQGTFQYAGMMWLSRPGVYAPTFRAYAQHLGRFNQADPLRYGGDGPNLYAYVLDDPMNRRDSLGLAWDPSLGAQPAVNCLADCTGPDVFVTGSIDPWLHDYGKGGFLNGIGGLAAGTAGFGGGGGGDKGKNAQCPLAPKYNNFFSKNYIPALSVAIKYDTNVANLLGLSAHESGWGTSSMFSESNNPFGATPRGDSTPGVSYRSLSSAWQNWGDQWGARIAGTGANANQFVSNLLQNNQGVTGAADQRGAYNSQVAPGGDPNWANGVLGSIAGVKNRLPQWGPAC